jgi:hypothetical protein
MCTAVLYSLAETPQPTLPPHLGSYTRALLVSQDRRHICVTPVSTKVWFKFVLHVCALIGYCA